MLIPFRALLKSFCLLFVIAFPFFLKAAEPVAEPPIAVYLTWQKEPHTTMTIQWITYKNVINNVIQYHAAGDSFWQNAAGICFSTPEGLDYLIHRVELLNLRSQTEYYFRLNKQGKIYKFKTMPADTNTPIRFVVGGDIYHESMAAVIEMNRQAAKTAPLFALVGGDLAYGEINKHSSLSDKWKSWTGWLLHNGEGKFKKRQRWIEWLAAWSDHMITPDGRLIPMVPTLGNHDVDGGFDRSANDAACFHAFFPFPSPQGYNVLDFSNYMAIFTLDSGHTNPIEGKQSRWLYEALRTRELFPHKFAIYHVPAYPSVRPFNNPISLAIRNFWVPIFERYGIAAAFEHHDHAYKRTYRIKKNRIDPEGILYLGDGGWGVTSPRQAKKGGERWYLEKAIPKSHFILVTIEGGRRHFAAIDSKGDIFDAAYSNWGADNAAPAVLLQPLKP